MNLNKEEILVWKRKADDDLLAAFTLLQTDFILETIIKAAEPSSLKNQKI